MPDTKPLDFLIARLAQLIRTSTDALEEAYPDGVAAWQSEVSRQLARYHAAAMLTGANTDTLSPAMRDATQKDLSVQLRYLRQFGVAIQEADAWQAGWQSRAAMYARGIQIPYWQGVTKLLPLPAMPAEGTDCMTNCKCQWEIDTLDGDNNYDAYWRRGADDSCATCRQREAEWSPVRIRGGVLQV